ncbi:hypothetical protein HOY82DRAFT_570818, partial [Tuber indicum]
MGIKLNWSNIQVYVFTGRFFIISKYFFDPCFGHKYGFYATGCFELVLVSSSPSFLSLVRDRAGGRH